MYDKVALAITIFTLQYAASGLIFASLLRHPRKRVFILRALILQNRVQLLSALVLIGLHTVSREPLLAFLWGAILCYTIHLSTDLAKRAPHYNDYLETNENVLVWKDALSAYIREVGQGKHKPE